MLRSLLSYPSKQTSVADTEDAKSKLHNNTTNIFIECFFIVFPFSIYSSSKDLHVQYPWHRSLGLKLQTTITHEQPSTSCVPLTGQQDLQERKEDLFFQSSEHHHSSYDATALMPQERDRNLTFEKYENCAATG